MTWLIIVVVFVALALGYFANTRWLARPAAAEDETGLGISDLVEPMTTLAVVLLAFILAEGLSSYGRARDQASEEARVLDAAAESASRVKDLRLGQDLQGEYICYGRAVVKQEWPAMGHGDRAPGVGVWTNRVETVITELENKGEEETDRLIEADNARGDVRLRRLSESKPTIPNGLKGLMLVAVLISVFSLAFFMQPKAGEKGVHLAVLIVITSLLAMTLYTINDLDTPFAKGLNTIQPTEMRDRVKRLEDDFAKAYPGATVPCEADGRPI